MVSMLVALQASWIGRVDDLLRIGPARLARSGAHGPHRRRRPTPFRGPPAGRRRDPRRPSSTACPARFAAIAACGLPDTLVHGDFHPGNVRGTPGHLTMLDWGDCGVGHPLLDLPAFLEVVAAGEPRRGSATHWLAAWTRGGAGLRRRRAPPSSSAPVAAARQAVIYQTFVDNIEPVERRHHDADVLEWLSRTAAIARDG